MKKKQTVSIIIASNGHNILRLIGVLFVKYSDELIIVVHITD